MWIDTHCHLDAAEFDADREDVVGRAAAGGVAMMVIPAVEVKSFDRVRDCARRYGFGYALGIHPLATPQALDDDLDRLRDTARAALGDPRFVAIGEIGLDYYVEGLDRERQQRFYEQQLRLARELSLPVILHVRRSADGLLRTLRQVEVGGGIAHAFNGPEPLAARFVDIGFKLGFGGSSTYDGSLRIRRLAAGLADSSIVLETDAPDIPPQWLREPGASLRNEPAQLPRIAATVAGLRGLAPDALARLNQRNAIAALPRLGAWFETRRDEASLTPG
ncbi:MAG TPA: TatD family hydrolase [Burkholderiaceae bacterium]